MTELTQKQELSLNIIRDISKPCSLKAIMQRAAAKGNAFDSFSQAQTVLKQLVEIRLVKKYENGQFVLIKNSKAKDKPSKPVSVAKKQPGKTHATKTATKKAKEAPPTVFQALDDLKVRLTAEPHVIHGVELKLEVLDRLSLILDPTIGVVLTGIGEDLQEISK